MRIVEIYREHVPEDFESTTSITIKSKDSERSGLEYDLVCALIDIAGKHSHLKDVEIIDRRR
jgi:hypothetical protein